MAVVTPWVGWFRQKGKRWRIVTEPCLTYQGAWRKALDQDLPSGGLVVLQEGQKP